jgi:hypothetical protein
MVRKIADDAEDVVWKRLKHYGFFSGALVTLVVGLFALEGIKTMGDAKSRVEPIIVAAEQRAQKAKRDIDETAAGVNSVKGSLDQLSRDVDTQTKRYAVKGGEISQKLATLDASATAAQARVEAMEKSLGNRVEQVSKQVETLSIQQAFPTLGQKMYVTYQGNRWDSASRKPNEVWVSIYIDATATSDLSSDQVEKLVQQLKNAGYSPLVGMFGVAGPYSTAYPMLAPEGCQETTVFYFKKNLEPTAKMVGAIVMKALPIPSFKSAFVDSASFAKNDSRNFIVPNSGIDLQVCIHAPVK